MKNLVIPALILLLMSCATQKEPVQTVQEVDLARYAGLWYEIAHLPARFQKNCECTTAEYRLTDKGYVRVINRCRKSDSGKWKSARGKAFPVINTGNSVLKVQFFWPFKGDYRILALDDDYQYAMVGTNSRKYLWILSRTPHLDDRLYQRLVDQAATLGYDVTRLMVTRQDCAER